MTWELEPFLWTAVRIYLDAASVAERRANPCPWGRRWRARWVPGRRLRDREARWP
jgi:hypothetical protein